MGNELIATDLAELAQAINAEHEQAQAAVRAGLEHARRCGELLIDAKGRLQHGAWLPWLAANCSFSERTARGYMRVAGNWAELEKSATVADLTYRGALALLAEPREAAEGTEYIHPLIKQARQALALLDTQLDQATTMDEIKAVIDQAGYWQRTLAVHQIRAERELGKMLNVAEALREVRDRKLYRGSHETFEAYCADRWGLTADQLWLVDLTPANIGSLQ